MVYRAKRNTSLGPYALGPTPVDLEVKRLKTLKGAILGTAAVLVAVTLIGNKLDVWGFPLPASKASVDSLTLTVAETRDVVWRRNKRADNRDLWELEERCRANGGCTVDQAAQRRRLQEDIEEAEGKLEQIKKERQ